MNVEIILEIILIGIGLYLALIKSYFQEKGKNIATSEDIEELTLKVESVKQQFLEKNAYLQANLDLLTNLQISHKNDERLALIDFHKKINTWVGLLTEGTPSLLDPFDDQEIQTKIHQYALTYQKVLAAQAVLDLYVEDNKLIEIIIDLKMVIITRLHQPPIIFLLDLKKSNFEISQLDLEENLEKRTKNHSTIMVKRKNLYERYLKTMKDEYKEVLPISDKYRGYIKEYISKISME